MFACLKKQKVENWKTRNWRPVTRERKRERKLKGRIVKKTEEFENENRELAKENNTHTHTGNSGVRHDMGTSMIPTNYAK